MKYTRHIGYSLLFGAAMMTAAGMQIQAEENEPIPMEDQAILNPETEETLTEDSVTDCEIVVEEFEETEAAEAVNNEINNGIPVIYLHIDESRGTIDAMNEDPDHNTYCYGTMDFVLPSSDFKYADLDTDLSEYYDLEMQIKGRGNSTWYSDKKPYKIKLDKKTDLLGLGKDERSKHWVLLANAYDPSLVKDRITAYIGEEMGLDYTPLGAAVDVVMNDEYLGSYLLMEHVRVDKNRIDIDELNENDVSEDVITGGYVVQNGNQESPDSVSFFTTSSGLKWFNHTPSFAPDEGDYENDIQKNYIRNYMQMIEDILYSDTQIDEAGNPYSYYMDIPSAAKYWLIQAFSNNNDAYDTGSTYLYKKRDTESEVGKLYWGPLWDFDLGWGITDMTDGGPYEGYDIFIVDWILPMLYDTSPGSFCQQILDYWPQLRSIVLEIAEDNELIDKYYDELKLSKEQDASIYDPSEAVDYRTRLDNLKSWIKRRAAWLDENLPDLPNQSHKVKIIEEGKPDEIHYMRNNYKLSLLTTPEKKGYVFAGWMTEDGTIVTDQTAVTSDLILTPLFVTEEEATKYEEILFARDEDSIVYFPEITYYPIFQAFPEDAQLKTITWTSSDESIASVSEEGTVFPYQTGDVTITATLPTGNSASLILHILDEKIAPEDVNIMESLTLRKGEHGRIEINPVPSYAVIDNLQVIVETSDIVSIDPSSMIITALEVGSVPVNVYALYFSPDGQTRLVWKKTCIVTVIEEEPGEEIIDNQPSDNMQEILPYVQADVHGIPTGISTNIRLWISSMIISALGIFFNYKRNKTGGV